MKEWVRTHKKLGQLLLTGSVRFSSRKAMRESLTGRIIVWELLPMDFSERNNQSLSNSLIHLLNSKNFKKDFKYSNYFTEKSYQRYLSEGGLPGVFAIRDPAIRAQKFETQLNTILVVESSPIKRTLLS